MTPDQARQIIILEHKAELRWLRRSKVGVDRRIEELSRILKEIYGERIF